MKKLTLLTIVISLASCQFKQKESNSWEPKYAANGKDSVVNVNYTDNNGHQNNFFMNYLLFRMLYGNGGYSNVYQYYNTHPQEFTSPASYQNYQARPGATSGSASGSSTKSYSSPSRSTYSSPSRSYSAPTHSSYSSPSRSYSSPSRSYSSPSRGH